MFSFSNLEKNDVSEIRMIQGPSVLSHILVIYMKPNLFQHP